MTLLITLDLPVDDVRRARVFYRRLFRAKLTRDRFVVGCDDLSLQIVDERRWTPGRADRDYRRGVTPRLELRVDDVADWIARAVATGARLRCRLTPGAGGVLREAVTDAEPVLYAHIIDPFGHL